MKAIIFFSMSKKQNSRNIANLIEGDIFEIINKDKEIKCVPFQMFYYGYKTVFKKPVQFEIAEIDFEKYEEIVLVSPVWAGRVNIFMNQFLMKNQFKDKKVTIIGTCSGEGGYKKYFESYDGLLDGSNKVVEHIMHLADKLIYEKKV